MARGRTGPLLTATLLALAGAWAPACSVFQDGGELPEPAPVPLWVADEPRDEGDRWVAAGTGVADELDQAQERAREDGLWRLLRAARGTLPSERPPRVPGLRVHPERRFVERLEGGRLRVTLEVSAPELSLRPDELREELLASAAPDEHLALLGDLARELLRLGLDDEARRTLARADDEPVHPPADLLTLAGLHRLLGDEVRAGALNAEALAALADRPAEDPVRRAASLQAERLAAGIVPVDDSLLALERLTVARADPAVLLVPLTSLQCTGSEIATLSVELPQEAGVLVPLLVTPQRVAVERLSDEGRVRRRSLPLMLGLPGSCEEGVLLLWVVPEGARVLEAVGRLAREPLERRPDQLDDDDRRLLQDVLSGLRQLDGRPGVAAARVRLHR